MKDTFVPWSQVETMLEMAQAALSLKSCHAEKLLAEKLQSEQELLYKVSQAQRLQKSAMLNAEQLRQTLEATAKEKQVYLQRTEEMGVELRSQEHEIELLEAENAKLEREKASLQAQLETLDANNSHLQHFEDGYMDTATAQSLQQNSSELRHPVPNGLANKHIPSMVSGCEIEAASY